jgi:hypothetical protein
MPMSTVMGKPVAYTFSEEGLSAIEKKFLIACETLYFAEKKISREEIFLPALDMCGVKIGTSEVEKCFEAWKYWESLNKPIDRQSLKEPRKLMDIFVSVWATKLKPEYFWIKFTDDTPSMYAIIKKEYFEALHKRLGLIYSLNANNFYFEVVNNMLYIKYQTIIGSRCICQIQGK